MKIRFYKHIAFATMIGIGVPHLVNAADSCNSYVEALHNIRHDEGNPLSAGASDFYWLRVFSSYWPIPKDLFVEPDESAIYFRAYSPYPAQDRRSISFGNTSDVQNTISSGSKFGNKLFKQESSDDLTIDYFVHTKNNIEDCFVVISNSKDSLGFFNIKPTALADMYKMFLNRKLSEKNK